VARGEAWPTGEILDLRDQGHRVAPSPLHLRSPECSRTQVAIRSQPPLDTVPAGEQGPRSDSGADRGRAVDAQGGPAATGREPGGATVSPSPLSPEATTAALASERRCRWRTTRCTSTTPTTSWPCSTRRRTDTNGPLVSWLPRRQPGTRVLRSPAGRPDHRPDRVVVRCGRRPIGDGRHRRHHGRLPELERHLPVRVPDAGRPRRRLVPPVRADDPAGDHRMSPPA
jgi:hypothetical protein